jgi:hypothetical protein
VAGRDRNVARNRSDPYEALYIHGDSFLSIFDWPFVVIGFTAFIALVVEAVSDRLSKTE